MGSMEHKKRTIYDVAWLYNFVIVRATVNIVHRHYCVCREAQVENTSSAEGIRDIRIEKVIYHNEWWQKLCKSDVRFHLLSHQSKEHLCFKPLHVHDFADRDLEVNRILKCLSMVWAVNACLVYWEQDTPSHDCDPPSLSWLYKQSLFSM